MDRPMRVNGPNAYDLVLAEVATGLGVVTVIWAVLAVVLSNTLLPTETAASGLLAGAALGAGLCLILAGGDARGPRPILRLGLWLLGAVAVALVIVGSIEGRAGAIIAGAALLAGRLLAGGLALRASRSRYKPRWFSPRLFETMIATTDTMLDADGREAIPPARAAARTDRLLASIDAPVLPQICLLFRLLEWVLPALILRPIPFSMLGGRARRQLVLKLIGVGGLLRPLRSAARTMKVLSCAGYYSDPTTMRAVGFVEYEGSPRSVGKDLSPRHYPDPHNPPPRKPSPNGHVDAVIIGSGASGSVMAYELARRDLDVVVIECGRREDPQTFEHDEMSMFARVYKDGGLQTAADRNTAIFQGCTVGGSTVINNAIWLRPPELSRVLADWRARGADVPETRLLAAYGDLGCALRVGPIDRAVANPGTDVFLRGAGSAGKLLDNNRFECLGCGWCNYGCRYNRKTSMLVTYIPWAEALGARIEDQVLNARIVLEGKRAVGVEGLQQGKRLEVRADRVIVCAGAIGSSAVLLSSGINHSGRVGQHFHVLGGLFVTGDMGEVVDGFAGIGLTCMADEGAEYVLESYFAPPLAFSVRVSGWLLSHFDRMERYRHFIDGGVMVGTQPEHGRVSLSGGNPKIDLVPTGRDIKVLKDGLKRMADIYFKAGARRVYPSTFKYIDLLPDNYERVIDARINSIDDVLFGSAHPQGGNVMHHDRNLGVVDEEFRVHGFDGLYVADTSVWPSNIRANCQATAMAMAHYAAECVFVHAHSGTTA